MKHLKKFIQTTTELGSILHGIWVEKFLAVHIFPQAASVHYI
jgi:hypothetical protein